MGDSSFCGVCLYALVHTMAFRPTSTTSSLGFADPGKITEGMNIFGRSNTTVIVFVVGTKAGIGEANLTVRPMLPGPDV